MTADDWGNDPLTPVSSAQPALSPSQTQLSTSEEPQKAPQTPLNQGQKPGSDDWGNDPLTPMNGGSVNQTSAAQQVLEQPQQTQQRGFFESMLQGAREPWQEPLGPSREFLEFLDRAAPDTGSGFFSNLLPQNAVNLATRAALAAGSTAADIGGRLLETPISAAAAVADYLAPDQGAGREIKNLANFMMLGVGGPAGAVGAASPAKAKVVDPMKGQNRPITEYVQDTARWVVHAGPDYDQQAEKLYHTARDLYGERSIANWEREQAANPRSWAGFVRDIAAGFFDENSPRIPLPGYATQVAAAGRHLELSRRFGTDPTRPMVERQVQDAYKQLMDLANQGQLTTAQVDERLEEIKSMSTPTLQKSGEAIAQQVYKEVTQKTSEEYEATRKARNAQAEAEIKAAERLGDDGTHVKTDARDALIKQLQEVKTSNELEATKTIQDGWRAYDSKMKGADPVAVAKEAGDLWGYMDRAIGRQAENLYQGVYKLAGGGEKRLSPELKMIVKNTTSNLREDLQSLGPQAVQMLDKVLESGTASFEEMHFLQKSLQKLYDRNKFAPDAKTGIFEHYARAVKEELTDPKAYNDGDHPWKAAANELKRVNEWYKQNRAFAQDKLIQRTIDETRAGMLPEPSVLTDLINKEGYGPRRRELIRLAEEAQRRQGKPVDFRQKLLASTLNRVALDARTDADSAVSWNNIDADSFFQSIHKLHNEGVLRDLLPAETAEKEARELYNNARQIGQFKGNVDLSLGSDGSFTNAVKRAAEATKALDKMSPTDAIGILVREATESDKRATAAEALELKRAKAIAAAKNKSESDIRRGQDKLYKKNLQDHPLSFFTAGQEVSAAARKLLSRDNVEALRSVINHFKDTHPEIIQLLRDEAIDIVMKPIFESVFETKGIRPDVKGAAAAYRSMSKYAQETLFPGEAKAILDELPKQLGVLIGEATHSMPGMGAGEILGQSMLKRIWHIATNNLFTFLIVHPELARFLLRDLKAQPKIAKDILRSLMFDTLGMRMSMAAAVYDQNSQKNASGPPDQDDDISDDQVNRLLGVE